MLPDDLFIGLIDVDLQNQIAESDDMDKDAMEALATLLNQGNATLVNNAKDWTRRNSTIKIFCSSKEKITSRETTN